MKLFSLMMVFSGITYRLLIQCFTSAFPRHSFRSSTFVFIFDQLELDFVEYLDTPFLSNFPKNKAKGTQATKCESSLFPSGSAANIARTKFRLE